MIDKQLILKNYEPEEKLLLAKVLDQAYLCSKNGDVIFTDFIDPVKIISASNILLKTKYEVEAKKFGGFAEAERQMLGICPNYRDIVEKDFPISALKIKPKQSEFTKLPTHRDYLGSLMALGIKREKIGDIVLSKNNEMATVFVNSDICEYIKYNLEKVANSAVAIDISDDVVEISQRLEEKQFTLSSLRADCYIACVFHISRSKAEQLINSEKLMVNFVAIKSCSQNLKINDIITLRGFGRSKLKNIIGTTKKGKISVLIDIYK